MASQTMLKTEAARAQRIADVARAAEVAERFDGWHVFSSRDGKARLATRTGNQQPPTGDGTWAATVVANSWDDLERLLTEQQQHDTERNHGAASDRAPLTERIGRFRQRHRELRIAAPWATRSGLWEVSAHGKADTTAYDNGHRMMDTLEARYPEDR
jgi:hypothetical protein